MRIALDQHELLQKYDYDPITGILTRKHQVRNHAAGSVVGKIISSGYLQTTHNKKLVLVHRIIWTMTAYHQKARELQQEYQCVL